MVLLHRPLSKLAFCNSAGGRDEIWPVLRDLDPAAVDAREGIHRLQQLPGQVKLADRRASTMSGQSRHHLEEYRCSRARTVPTARPRCQAHPGRPRHPWCACRSSIIRSRSCRAHRVTLGYSGRAAACMSARAVRRRGPLGFRANPDTTKEGWDEFVRCLPQMWTQETFAYQGEFWSMPGAPSCPRSPTRSRTRRCGSP